MNFAEIEQGATVVIDDVTGLTSADALAMKIIVLQEYNDESLCITEQLAKDADGYVIGIYGDELGITKYYQWDNGFISTVIPEPSTVAAILGLLAITFAFARRSKMN